MFSPISHQTRVPAMHHESSESEVQMLHAGTGFHGNTSSCVLKRQYKFKRDLMSISLHILYRIDALVFATNWNRIGMRQWYELNVSC